MTTQRYLYLFGILAILISLVTWSIDVAGWVEPCIFCRIERTIIGLLGLLTLLPFSKISSYLGIVLGFFGASVASHHIFLLLKLHFFNWELLMVICALFIIIAQVILLLSPGSMIRPHNDQCS